MSKRVKYSLLLGLIVLGLAIFILLGKSVVIARVVTPEGQPVTSVWVGISRDDAENTITMRPTGQQGEFAIEVTPGAYALAVGPSIEIAPAHPTGFFAIKHFRMLP